MLISLALISSIIAALSNSLHFLIWYEPNTSVIITDLTAHRHYVKKIEANGSVRNEESAILYWNSIEENKSKDLGEEEYELQYWRNTPLSFLLPAERSIILNEKYYLLKHLPSRESIGFRVRYRTNSWHDLISWGTWSHESFLPPNVTTSYTATCPAKQLGIYFMNSSILLSLILSLSSILGFQIPKLSVSGKKMTKSLIQEVAELRGLVKRQEMKLNSLKRFHNEDISKLSLEDLAYLEHTLCHDIQIVRNEIDSILRASQDRHLCVICLDEEKSIVLFPCRHLCLCTKCLKVPVSVCPVCRSKITSTISIYS